MSTFSPSDAAFEGFRLTREKPKVLLAWALASFLIGLLTVPLTISSGVAEALASTNQANDAAAASVLFRTGPIALLVLVVGLFVQAIFYTAVYRAILRPQDKAFAYLRLGMDEVRQVILFLVLILILMLAVFVIVLLGSILAAIASGLLGAGGPAGRALAALIGLGIAIYVFGLVLYVAVRLSLALPMTFAQRRLTIAPAWRLTKGHFWRMIGAYFLAFILFVVVLLLAMIIFYAFAAVVGLAQGLDLGASVAQYEADLASLRSYFTIPTIIGAAFGALLSAVYYAVMVAPSATIYQALAGEPVGDVAATAV